MQWYYLLNQQDDSKEMRGFFVCGGDPDPRTRDYEPLAEPTIAGDKVTLYARIYNYSVVSAALNVPVRFDLVPINRETNLALGSRTILGMVTAQARNQDGTFGGASIPPRGMARATISLDSRKWGPQGGDTRISYRVYVVVDPDLTIRQTHAWRQPTLYLIPHPNPSAGDQYTITLEDSSGNTLDTICYTVSKGGLGDACFGLAKALNDSKMLTPLSLSIETYTPPGQNQPRGVLVYSQTVRETIPSTEFRAGVVVDKAWHAIYFVPAAAGGASGATGAQLAATNEEIGQNNEGWCDSLTTFADTPPPTVDAASRKTVAVGIGAHPSLRAFPSGATAVSFRGDSLAAYQGGKVVVGKVSVPVGQRLRLRVTIDSDEIVRRFIDLHVVATGADGPREVVAARRINGVDPVCGGFCWFTWAPRKSGVYTLTAHLSNPPRRRPRDRETTHDSGRRRVDGLASSWAGVNGSSGQTEFQCKLELGLPPNTMEELDRENDASGGAPQMIQSGSLFLIGPRVLIRQVAVIVERRTDQ